jgi:putative ABC transport system permease protein
VCLYPRPIAIIHTWRCAEQLNGLFRLISILDILSQQPAKKRKFRPSASFWEAARIAFDSLSKSKLRSFLTLLGIILATSTLIAVLSFVNGMNVYIATKLSDMGSDGFRVVRMAFIGNWDPKKFLEMQRRNPQVKPDEYEFIKANAQTISAIGMETERGVNLSYSGQTMQQVDFQGITADIPGISNIEVGVGRALSDRAGYCRQVFHGRRPDRQEISGRWGTV